MSQVCPRCGQDLADSDRIHLACLLARIWQIFGIPATISVVLGIIVIGFALTSHSTDVNQSSIHFITNTHSILAETIPPQSMALATPTPFFTSTPTNSATRLPPSVLATTISPSQTSTRTLTSLPSRTQSPIRTAAPSRTPSRTRTLARTSLASRSTPTSRELILLNNGIGISSVTPMNNGEFQVEGYCRGGNRASQNGTDWFCGTTRLTSSDFSRICQLTYGDPNAIAIQGNYSSRPAYNWRCHSYPLTVGSSAMVNTTNGDKLNMRSEASITARIVTQLLPGTVVSVVGGSRSRSGYIWWQVRSGEHTGWVVESIPGERTLLPR